MYVLTGTCKATSFLFPQKKEVNMKPTYYRARDAPWQLNNKTKRVVLCVWISVHRKRPFFISGLPCTGDPRKEVNHLSASTSPLPYTGNKSCIVNTILSVMPKHTVYIEPCMGSAEVFFRKPKAEREILNDYNGDLVNLFRTIQSNKKLVFLIGRLYLSINSELVCQQNKERLYPNHHPAIIKKELFQKVNSQVENSCDNALGNRRNAKNQWKFFMFGLKFIASIWSCKHKATCESKSLFSFFGELYYQVQQ